MLKQEYTNQFTDQLTFTQCIMEITPDTNKTIFFLICEMKLFIPIANKTNRVAVL